jgi:hypothetical protein
MDQGIKSERCVEKTQTGDEHPQPEQMSDPPVPQPHHPQQPIGRYALHKAHPG